MKDFSFVSNAHPAYIESLYKDYRKDPETIDEEWASFFEGFDFAVSSANGKQGSGDTLSPQQISKEFSVYQLIRAYRKRGHLIAKTNPIRPRKDRHAQLDLKYFDLEEADLDQEFYAGSFIGKPKATLKEIVGSLQKWYASSMGIEFEYIDDPIRRGWIRDHIDNDLQQPIPLEKKKRILEKLNEASVFENFLHTKFIGQKRFSLEGGENAIPALDTIIQDGADLGVQEVVIGMAHRGRLNVLTNILGKTYEQIFEEFEGRVPEDKDAIGSGDVKYHVGFRSDITTLNNKKVNIQMVPNPSHLELVNSVVNGYSRSKADVLYKSDYNKILPILIHGDSAIAGQGIIYEVLQMSKLRGYYTGGTIHFVINNQIGFTTDFDDARSADYCTSIASMVEAPVFHVNGDDAEAVAKVAELAIHYRQRFNTDIFIDMVCYRKYGHNEGDDPKYTQPKLYELIDKHPSAREIYNEQLTKSGEVDAGLAKEMKQHFWKTLQDRLDEVKQHPLKDTFQEPEKWWQELRNSKPEDFDQSPETAVSKETLQLLVEKMVTVPKDFTPLRKIKKLLKDKKKLFEEKGLLDWSMGELAAYGSILLEKKDVRMSGQDVVRGTFSHRHSILQDAENYKEYNRLSKLSNDQGKFRIFNSLLSESAAVGFEFGYALANPNTLTIWEAQFGDFANGAQSVFDQFVSSSEQKWERMDGLVVLLPHGYEGQGPEHSSARMERYLQMTAEYNIIITNCTTAANFFHVLRRQLAFPFRKPLFNFSPKANLRHPGSFSPAKDFTEGKFKEIIEDEYCDKDPAKIKKVLLCSGKIYFDLQKKQTEEERKEIAIIRLEQLYPLPHKKIEELVEKYDKANWFWVQEEPLNMGAAWYIKMNLSTFDFGIISRQSSASPATGYGKVHKEEEKELLDKAFSVLN